jgi:hypothetical protein
MTNRQPAQIFVSAAAGFDASAVRDLVRAANMTAVGWQDLPPAPLVDAISKQIANCNGVVGVVAESGVPASVVFEVGVAIGQGKPVVLLLEDRDGQASIPPVLAGLPLVVLGGNVLATSSRLAEALAKPPIPVSAALRPELTRLQSKVEDVAARAWTDESELRVATAFAALGARVIPQSPGNTRARADLAIWLDTAALSELNPVLVEVAGRRAQRNDKIDQLAEHLRATRCLLGLVVMQEPHEPAWHTRPGVIIATVGLEWLQAVSPEDFARELTRGRNQFAHGAS